MTEDEPVAVPGQLPLFGDDAPPPLSDARGAPVYSRFKPANPRTGCDDCRERLHTLGIARAPFPNPARWRRTDKAGDTLLLCHEHKAARREAER
jgi:hypothetical protein